MTYSTQEQQQDINLSDIDTGESDFINEVQSSLEDTSKRKLGKDVYDLFQDTEIVSMCESFGEVISSSETGMFDLFYSVVQWEMGSCTIGEAISGSQYQEQFGVLPTAIKAFFLSREIGFFNIGALMLQPIQLLRMHDGSIVVLGGHHRLFALCMMAYKGGCDWEDIMSQEIPANIASIHKDKLAEILQLKPSVELDKAIVELEAQLWLSSNGSRKSTNIEVQSYKNQKRGVNLRNADSILDSEILSMKDKAIFYFTHLCEKYGYLPDRNGAVLKQFALDPSSDDEEFKFWMKPNVTTLSAVVSSAVVNLNKIKVSLDDESKPVAKWQPSLNSVRYMPKLIDSLFEQDDETGLTLIDEAIIAGCANQTGYEHNIARAKSSIGQELAQLIDSTIEPPLKAVPKAKAQKSTGTVKAKFKGRRVV